MFIRFSSDEHQMFPSDILPFILLLMFKCVHLKFMCLDTHLIGVDTFVQGIVVQGDLVQKIPWSKELVVSYPRRYWSKETFAQGSFSQ